MKVLVTGGTGVVGLAAVDCLLARGHTVRLFSRHADQDGRQWPHGVEPHPGDVGDEASVRGAAEGCGAVLHVAGIVAERPPEVTFRDVNVEGTRRVVEEARRAGVRRFVYVSSLGAERGSSDYHRSKRAAEEVVQRDFPGEWLVCRPGNVYGPGDDVVSLLLKMVRALPAVPVIGGGDQPFQPVWAEDLGEALARALEEGAPARRVLELAGTEVTTTGRVLDLLEEITGKSPPRVPVPEWLAQAGAGTADFLGLEIPVNADQVTMLLEENVILPGRTNALTELFGITPTPLAEGLRKLANTLPERLPSQGVGPLQRSRYWVDVRGSRLGADELFDLVSREFSSLAPDGLLRLGTEPGAGRELVEGATVTLAIPLRGNVQVRIEEVENRTATAVTLRGHPLSGVIRFEVEDRGEVVRFEVRSYTRASSLFDWVGMETIGEPLRRATWTAFVENVARRSGGSVPEGVQTETVQLTDEQAERVERMVEELVTRRKREDAGGE